MSRWRASPLLAILVLTLGACMNAPVSPEPPANADADLLVKGDVVHVQGEPNPDIDDFVFTTDSHVVVQLFYSWSAGGDAPGELLAETRLEGITGFPVSYQIKGDPEKVFSREGDYFLMVTAYSGAGDELHPGDLMNEVYTPVPVPGAEVRVELKGVTF